MSRFLASLSFTLLASSLLLAGCDQDSPRGNGRFADAAPTNRVRAAAAAMGIDIMMAGLHGGLYALSQVTEPGACPAVTRRGTITTVTGNCDATDRDFGALGSMVIENVGFD